MPQQFDCQVLIVGAGPTGLGAAWRLEELGCHDWLLLDQNDYPGGLAASFTDEAGFTWDVGGHVVFSHYEYFDALLDQLVGDAWVEHVREAWVWMRDRFIPYPLQNNIWRLPEADLIACLDGLLAVHRAPPAGRAANFREWLLAQFGRGLFEAFLLPYNEKVWAWPPERLDTNWMGERVATVDLARILRNLVRRQDDVSWGPNSRFRFPLHGGTGAIWRALWNRLPDGRKRLGRRVLGIDAARRVARLDDGSQVRYAALVSTVPLDLLLPMLVDRPDLHPAAGEFLHSASHIVGVGLEGPTPAPLATKCWMYFPEPECPFYRTTLFSNYSPNNVPRPGEQWSLMAEVSESPVKPVDAARVVEEVVAGLRWAKLIPPGAEIVDTWNRRLEHGYPTPFVGRDGLLERIEPELRRAKIYSRGRFGAWKYEVSNMDHSLMQGVEVADHLLLGSEETTLRFPQAVNAARGQGRRPGPAGLRGALSSSAGDVLAGYSPDERRP